jgi:hypothetical protein
MNPLKWPRPHQIALLISMLIGAVVGPVIGYLIYAIAQGGGGSVDFQYWLGHPIRLSGIWWAFVGTAIGGGLLYIKRLLM